MPRAVHVSLHIVGHFIPSRLMSITSKTDCETCLFVSLRLDNESFY